MTPPEWKLSAEPEAPARWDFEYQECVSGPMKLGAKTTISAIFDQLDKQ
jgi:hypothetical protein